MKRLTGFSFYGKTQISFIILILLPLVLASFVSYYIIKDIVINKVNASNQNVIDVVSSELGKNVEDIIYAMNLFSNKDSNSYSDLLAYKDVNKLTSSKEFATNKRISESLDLAFSKTSGLSAQVFYVNKSGFVIYAANSMLEYETLHQWISKEQNDQLNKNEHSSSMRWEKVDDLKQFFGNQTDSYYFAIKEISAANGRSSIGTLYVGIPYEYFKRSFKNSGIGQLKLYSEAGDLIIQDPDSHLLKDQKQLVTVESIVPKTRWKLEYQYSAQEITGEISQAYSYYAIVLSLCILLFLSISILLAKTLHKPLKKLQWTAEKFGDGNMLVRFPVKGKDEIAVLGTAFNHMLDQINLLLQRVEQEHEEKRIIELQALFSQIQPHFLLNTLNSIKCNLVNEGDSINSRQVEALMSLLRAYLRVNEQCSLKQECKLLGDYVEIMKMRNDLNLQFDVKLAAKVEDMEVPRLFLQPLVENAIIHGFDEGWENASIWVTAELNEGYCTIEVKDNGIGLKQVEMDDLLNSILRHRAESQVSNKGIGLTNVYNRLRLTYGNEITINMQCNEFDGLSIFLRFPYNGKLTGGRIENG